MVEILGTKQFVDEARNSAALYHQNIVPVFEAGRYQDGGFYVACQLVEGPNLQQVLEEPLELKNALRIARDLAFGVAHAHEHGVIHNDIKPANVLVGKLGEPKLTDFGMSQLTDSQKGSLSGGSIPYVAPERLKEIGTTAPDVRSDIWSLGILLHELVFGRRCFQGNRNEIIDKIKNPDFFASDYRDEWPDADLFSIFKKCVAFKPENRYESAKELAEDLTRYINGQVVSTREPPGYEKLTKWAKRKPAIASLAAALFMAVSAIAVGSLLYGNWMKNRANELAKANQTIKTTLEGEAKAKDQAQSNLEKAVRSIRKSHIAVANHPQFLVGTSGTQSIQLALGQQAISLVKDLEINDTTNSSARTIALANFEVGRANRDMEKFGEAIEAFELVVEKIEGEPVGKR